MVDAGCIWDPEVTGVTAAPTGIAEFGEGLDMGVTANGGVFINGAPPTPGSWCALPWDSLCCAEMALGRLESLKGFVLGMRIAEWEPPSGEVIAREREKGEVPGSPSGNTGGEPGDVTNEFDLL